MATTTTTGTAERPRPYHDKDEEVLQVGRQEALVFRECRRGMRRVSGLKRQLLAAGRDLGVTTDAAATLLSSPRHIEFALVIDVRQLPGLSSPYAPSPRWLGFSYFGYLENLKRCFRKPENGLRAYFNLIQVPSLTASTDGPICVQRRHVFSLACAPLSAVSAVSPGWGGHLGQPQCQV